MIRRGLMLAVVALTGPVAQAAELDPDRAALTFRGNLQSAEGAAGTFVIAANLSGGNFSGRAVVSIAGTVLDAELVEARSYLENGKCILYLEQGRSRLELRGRCDDTSFGQQGGGFDAFIAGQGQIRGAMAGEVSVGPAVAQEAAEDVPMPTGELTCAWQEVHISAEASVPNEYLLAYSMMVVLTLNPDGTYETAASHGTYQLAANKLYFTSGAFEGAVGTLERDRSGEPAVVFHKAENSNEDGTQLIDPETTRCTTPRSAAGESRTAG